MTAIDAIDILDRAAAKAPLTRDEHIAVQQAIEGLRGFVRATEAASKAAQEQAVESK